MALVIKDRVRESTTTTGTGSVVLAGTSSGYQAFSVIGNANTTYYTIANPVANEWEVGIGTYTLSTTSLSRDTVLSSSSLSSIAAILSISQSTTTVTVNTVAAHGITAGQVITVNAIANATSLVSGTTATILTVGTTDFTLIGAASNTVGVSFTTTATVPLGTGTVTLNAQGTGKTVLTASGSILTYAGTSATYTAITLLTGFAGVLTPFTAGSKDVFVTYPAERSVYADGLNIVADNAAIAPVTSGGTGLATLTANLIPYGNGTNPFSSSANLTFDGTNLTTAGNLVSTAGNVTATAGTVSAKSYTPVAGTATAAPIVLTSGTNLTTATAGAIEYDGVNMYGTTDTTSGRSSVGLYNQFKLAANGSNINTIANFFGATSNISLVASALYEIEITMYFTKNTAGTVTWTLTNSAAPTTQNIYYEMSPVTGIVAPPGTTTMLVGQAVNATAAYSFATASLTTTVNHYARFKIQLVNGTGTSLKIQATSAAATTITPLAGSIWTARRLNPTNNGTYVA